MATRTILLSLLLLYAYTVPSYAQPASQIKDGNPIKTLFWVWFTILSFIALVVLFTLASDDAFLPVCHEIWCRIKEKSGMTVSADDKKKKARRKNKLP